MISIQERTQCIIHLFCIYAQYNQQYILNTLPILFHHDFIKGRQSFDGIINQTLQLSLNGLQLPPDLWKRQSSFSNVSRFFVCFRPSIRSCTFAQPSLLNQGYERFVNTIRYFSNTVKENDDLAFDDRAKTIFSRNVGSQNELTLFTLETVGLTPIPHALFIMFSCPCTISYSSINNANSKQYIQTHIIRTILICNPSPIMGRETNTSMW